jgi:hypothetical protein
MYGAVSNEDERSLTVTGENAEMYVKPSFSNGQNYRNDMNCKGQWYTNV